jgi:hypothetical protein
MNEALGATGTTTISPVPKYPILRSTTERLVTWVRSKATYGQDPLGNDRQVFYCADDKGALLGLAEMARDLGWDLSNASRYWKEAEKLGLVRRENGRLCLISNVPVPPEEKVDKRDAELSTHHLDKPTQLKVKDLSEEKYAEFLALWKAADQCEKALVARKMGRARSELGLIKDAIKRHFHFPVRRLRTRHQSERIELPPILAEFAAQRPFLEITENNHGFALTGNPRTDPPASSRSELKCGTDINPDQKFQMQSVHAQNGASKGDGMN